jgi:hypothetical protein
MSGPGSNIVAVRSAAGVSSDLLARPLAVAAAQCGSTDWRLAKKGRATDDHADGYWHLPTELSHFRACLCF